MYHVLKIVSSSLTQTAFFFFFFLSSYYSIDHNYDTIFYPVSLQSFTGEIPLICLFLFKKIIL